MGKRKRAEAHPNGVSTQDPVVAKKAKASEPSALEKEGEPLTIQIVAGSYDRILHGLTATITAGSQVDFADTFLFNAHSSAIRCLALSPPSAPEPSKSQKVMLASGSSDERINVYSLSAHPTNRKQEDALSSVAPRKILENPKNRELGTLLHHSSTITKLSFPTKSKLMSASDDSTIAVTRTRDWTVLSTIKAPIPKAQGRPSGDTAALGATPAGINDFAVHPSMKLMISVSKGERCMRLWNLMTAKKAGVLNFSREILQQVGEGKHSSGEGRKVVWGSTESGDEFCVGFDRDLLVFGMDSTARCRVMPEPRRKIHEFRYVEIDPTSESSLLAVSTEDGKIMFFSTKSEDLTPSSSKGGDKSEPLPVAKLVAQLGGKEAGMSGRIKDFAILRVPADGGDNFVIAAGSSDGRVRIFKLAVKDLSDANKAKTTKSVGKLLGTYETQNRITCLEAFEMIPRPEGVDDTSVMSNGEDGPPLLQPIPRRPFDRHIRELTPPDEDSIPRNLDSSSALNLEAINSRLLNPRNNAPTDSASISRADSEMNLTGSTLMGIYRPIFGRDRPSTPGGARTETPAKSLNLDDPFHEMQRERTRPTRRRSTLRPAPPPPPLSKSAIAFYLSIRVLLLSGLGILYGILVAQFQNRHKGILKTSGYDWWYMTFWVLAGNMLGSLLPSFDDIWEKNFGQDDVAIESAEEHAAEDDTSSKEPAFAPTIRIIGCFVGIAFAIRKLPWDSPLQLSLTLALVGPMLWYLIDRTTPSFVLSTAVGLAGSTVLMGLKPEIFPIPTGLSTVVGYAPWQNISSDGAEPLVRNRLPSEETLATGIWLLSVLFVSSLCFGNIGRWLALNKTRTTKGRWARRL
ncbi:insulin-induced protein-domain-containing protein [Xylariaceae sp. FL0662B]|nr:insulin-induced protein-domain-containing protein [Xylariaceae sp. FL0662B]